MPFIKLVRSVCRAPLSCGWCSYPVAEFDPLYSPTIGGVALGHYCKPEHAQRTQRAPMEVAYVG